ncbi:hypothetical protein [Rhodanobacter sp. FW106-PBR-LB-2-11]|uniref:hypothetical protein n=1 Tax=Rhodanobacter sp. FW106-PBR-LB-2-11 TaxID=1524463 RepID=UPI0034E51E64
MLQYLTIALIFTILANISFLRASRGDQPKGVEVATILFSLVTALGAVIALYPVAGRLLIRSLDDSLPAQGEPIHTALVTALALFVAMLTLLALMMPAASLTLAAKKRADDE